MTIRTHYYTTNETFEELVRKLKAMTHQVKFGPLNIMKRNFDRFPKPWVGEIDERGEYFKLFRTKGADHTSDLSVHGRFVVRSGEKIVEVKHKIHYMAAVGFAGLTLFIYAMLYLLGKRDITIHPTIQVIVYGVTLFI